MKNSTEEFFELTQPFNSKWHFLTFLMASLLLQRLSDCNYTFGQAIKSQWQMMRRGFISTVTMILQTLIECRKSGPKPQIRLKFSSDLISMTHPKPGNVDYSLLLLKLTKLSQSDTIFAHNRMLRPPLLLEG